jgi:uncharacterized oligopeptide transporter (OPT) family protein
LTHNVHILWFDYPANTNVLVSLVSFGVSGIYLSFFLTVVFLVGAVLFALAKGGKEIDSHLRDDAEKPAAVR